MQTTPKQELEHESLVNKQLENERLKNKKAKHESNRWAIIIITVVVILAWYANGGF